MRDIRLRRHWPEKLYTLELHVRVHAGNLHTYARGGEGTSLNLRTPIKRGKRDAVHVSPHGGDDMYYREEEQSQKRDK